VGVPADTQVVPLAPHAALLTDPTGALTLDQVRDPANAARWRNNPRAFINFGIGPETHWIRAEVVNLGLAREFWLATENKWLNTVDLYWVAPEGVGVMRGGTSVPPAERALREVDATFPMRLEAGEQRALYLRIQGRHVQMIALTLETPDYFSRKMRGRSQMDGVLLGTLAYMLLFHLFIWMSLRDNTYLYYSAAVFFATISTFCYLFSTEGPLADVHPETINWVLLVALWLGIASYFATLRAFLRTRHTMPRLDGVLLAVIAVSAGMTIPSVLAPGPTTALGYPINLAMQAISVFTVLYALAQGQKEARLVAAGIVVLALGVVGRFTVYLGWSEGSYFMVRSHLFAAGAQTLLLALALADRFYVLRQEKERAQAELMKSLERERHIQEEHSRTLAQRVEARTVQLRTALEDLDRLNRAKDQFFSVVAHDLRSPVSTLVGMSELLDNPRLDLPEDQQRELLHAMHKKSVATHLFLENLLQWSALRMQRVDFSPLKIGIASMVHDEFGQLKDQADQKGIRLRSDVPRDAQVLADWGMVQSVLRNLLGNAIKFSRPGGEVRVTAGDEDGSCRVSVSDDGIGIPQALQDKLFELGGKTSRPGTAGETGTGLGLLLCKELVNRCGGEMRVESGPQGGATLSFTLPRA
jgi:signal transduction histidine kinase